MNPTVGLALVAVFVISAALARRAGSPKRAAAVALLGTAVGMGLLRQIPLATVFGALGVGLWSSAPKPAGPRARQRSDVRTAALAMTLDHDTGDMDGEVLTGPFAGRQLSDLDAEELQALAAQLETDAESLSLLMAYLERTDRSAGATDDPPPQTAGMSETEALRVLGLEPGASRQEVREAYHRLIRRVHPDLGGSSALAAMINAARERLDPGG